MKLSSKLQSSALRNPNPTSRVHHRCFPPWCFTKRFDKIFFGVSWSRHYRIVDVGIRYTVLASLWKLPNWIQWLANFVFDCTLVLCCSGPNLLPVEMYADIIYTVWHVCAVSIKGNFGISGMNFDTDYRLFFMRLT